MRCRKRHASRMAYLRGQWLGHFCSCCLSTTTRHQCKKAVFHQRRQGGVTTLTKRPFAGLPLQCLELVGKLGPLYQSQEMQLIIIGRPPLNFPLPMEVRAIRCRSKTLIKTWAFPWPVAFHPRPLHRGCFQSKAYVAYDSLNYPYPHLAPFITRWFGPTLSTLCWPARWLFGANAEASDEALIGFLPTAIWVTTTSAGSDLLKQTLPLWRPQSHI